jgi:uncharacterized protein
MIFWLIFGAFVALSWGAAKLVGWIFDEASFDAAACGLTGAEAARVLLGPYAATIDVVATEERRWMNDHFDPRVGRIELSWRVGEERSVAAIAVAAHEAGHAMQSIEAATIFRALCFLTPVSIAATVAYMLIPFVAMILVPIGLGGILLVSAVGILAALLVVELLRLPVEIGASVRAIRMARAHGLLAEDEVWAARRVLAAAALTYIVAALNTAVILILMAGDGDD